MNHRARDELLRTLSLYGIASSVAAAANAVQVAVRLSHNLRPVTRLRVHAYDYALFIVLGCCIAIPVWIWSLLSARWSGLTKRLASLAVLATFGGSLGGLCLANDWANFVGKHEIPISPTAFGVLSGVLAVSGLFVVHGWLKPGWRRELMAMVAVVLAAGNAAVLPGGYPGYHLLVSVMSVALLAPAISHWLRRRTHTGMMICSVCFVAIGLGPFLLPPPRVVRQNLGISSGSALTPFVVHWLPRSGRLGTRRLPIEQTEWFKPRAATNAIPAQSVPWLGPDAAVLLLTVEALRSDVVEGRKHDGSLPNLAHIRDASLRFTNARSPSPSTLTTVTSILTGKYYSQIYFTEHAPGKVNPITDRSLRVPELLSQSGVRTVNVRAMWGLGPDFGVGRGFDEAPKTVKDFGAAANAMDLILEQLDRARSERDKRLFLFTHFVDSHAPYNLGGKRETPYESYIAELELIDRELGRLLKYLSDHQLTQRCLLIVSADHGEAFGEHGTQYHASTVYDELLRVPLMFLHPSLPSASSSAPVTLVDLSPTLLDLFRVATPGDFMGQSLVPVLLGRPTQFARPIAVDSGRRKQALFFNNGIKVLRDLMTGTVQVFDLQSDPSEQSDLTDADVRDVDPYVLATERFFDIHTLKVPGWKPPWRNF